MCLHYYTGEGDICNTSYLTNKSSVDRRCVVAFGVAGTHLKKISRKICCPPLASAPLRCGGITDIFLESKVEKVDIPRHEVMCSNAGVVLITNVPRETRRQRKRQKAGEPFEWPPRNCVALEPNDTSNDHIVTENVREMNSTHFLFDNNS